MRPGGALLLALLIGPGAAAREIRDGCGRLPYLSAEETAYARAKIDELWAAQANPTRNWYANLVRDVLAKGNPNVLYELQQLTQPLLRYAHCTGNSAMLSGLVEAYSAAKPFLVTAKKGSAPYEYWSCATDKCATWGDPAYRGREVPLYSGQFLYGAATAMKAVASIPAADRTPAMKAFLAEMGPVVVSHLERWVFAASKDRKAFRPIEGCRPARRFNHRDLLLAKRGKPRSKTALSGPHSYCSLILDADMLVVGAVAELLVAKARDGDAVTLSRKSYGAFYDYLVLGGELLSAHTTTTWLKDDAGRDVAGALIDRNGWYGHPDFSWAADEGADNPRAAGRPQSPRKNVGWDLMHFLYRWPSIGDSLYFGGLESAQYLKRPPRDLIGQALLAQHIQQIVYGAARVDPASGIPVFTNYLDGSNGWYAMRDDAAHPGFGPFGLSSAVLGGGFGFWAALDPKGQRIMKELLAASRADPQSPTGKAWASRYLGFTDSPSLILLMFLASLAW